VSELKPGWADKFDPQTQGGTDVEQRLRARGGRPFRICSDDVIAKARKGAHAGGATNRYRNQKLDKVLGPVEDDE
jgi:hypothetical protein